MIQFISELQESCRCVDALLERYLYAISSKHPTTLVQAMRYGVLLGGKRLRPFLVYQTGRLFGLNQNSLDAPAAAIECIHAYSLIHDDLPAMDNDQLRRSKPTCHIKFGDTIALLAGDALHTLAFTILANASMPAVKTKERLKMISVLAKASGAEGMCFGQALDLDENLKNNSAELLEMIHRNKTGALIRAAVHMGALAAGKKSKQIIHYLDSYAGAIGLAFQVQDDILDLIKDNERIRKNNKCSHKTYPSLLGLDMARAKVIDLYNESLTYLEDIKAIGYNTSMLVKLARYIIERKK
ncbi:(2E,6E)-farnesyl diphosphate synthase [Candidatus Palibaumannia cicadellinicola]|uniref:Octaprenyl diphosphate synthase n=1 Tax=Candidatus Palibaumannia cicadellinicola TaxID=186490 RepID=A0A0K2BKU9_9GAMM|nr:(2E,6E)-farnesyl diphosphate synthase [Candidatus Baumannia cicadellinicola]AKZ65824.1 Octaprenyl diphosphate synthase [Candidatus Baumannia cicadellinicola]